MERKLVLRRRRLQNKLVRGLVLFTLVLVVCLSAITSLLYWDDMLKRQSQSVCGQARLLADVSADNVVPLAESETVDEEKAEPLVITISGLTGYFDLEHLYILVPRDDGLLVVRDRASSEGDDMLQITETETVMELLGIDDFTKVQEETVFGNNDAYLLVRDDKDHHCKAMAPVYDDDDIIGYAVVEISNHDVLRQIHRTISSIWLAAILLMLAAGTLYYRYIRRIVLRPILALTQASRSLVQRTSEGKFDSMDQPGLSFDDEFGDLQQAMAGMEHELGSYTQELAAAVSEKERTRAELDLAQIIQLGMLAPGDPEGGEKGRLSLRGMCRPAREVGGDFYDHFMLDDDHLCMTMADVSGKGVPAALFMMMCLISIRQRAKDGETPAQVLRAVNESICLNNRADMFVTVWLGVLELSTGEVVACNAGHEYPVIGRADGRFELMKDRHGFVLGGMPGVKYIDYRFRLGPEDVLFLYTDGVPEATDAGQQLFGTERMLRALDACEDRAPAALVEAMERAVAEFVKEAPQFDDMTMLAVSRSIPSGDDKEKDKELDER